MIKGDFSDDITLPSIWKGDDTAVVEAILPDELFDKLICQQRTRTVVTGPEVTTIGKNSNQYSIPFDGSLIIPPKYLRLMSNDEVINLRTTSI